MKSGTSFVSAVLSIFFYYSRVNVTYHVLVARCTTGPRRADNNASRNHIFARSARCTTGPRRAVKD